MDTICMQTLIGSIDKSHEVNDLYNNLLVNDNMSGGHSCLLIEQPYVKIVNGQDARNRLEVVFDVVRVDIPWCALHEEAARSFHEW